MRVHQITHLFHPDSLAGASLYTDLARFIRDRGHDIRVTTTFPYYPALRYSESDSRLRYRDDVFENIIIRRVAMFLPRKHVGWRRLLPELSFLWRLPRYGRFDGWNPDVVLTSCPMLAQCAASHLMYPLVGRVAVVQDLMAAAAVNLNIIKAPGLARAIRAFEVKVFQQFTKVVTISDAMATSFARDVGRMPVVIPNWIHSSLSEGARSARARMLGVSRVEKELFYSGNVGVKQGLPDFVTMFAEANTGWRLDIRGGGAEIQALASRTAQTTSVSLGGLLDEGKYLDRLCRASAALITERVNAASAFLPSKILPALACGTPILAICDPASPLGLEVARGKFGVIVPPGDRHSLMAVLSRWGRSSHELEQLSANASEWAKQYEREAILKRYEEILIEACARTSRRSYAQ